MIIDLIFAEKTIFIIIFVSSLTTENQLLEYFLFIVIKYTLILYTCLSIYLF